MVVEQTVAETPEATAERKAARSGTVAERQAYAVRRREATAARDAERMRLAAELGERSGLTIRPEDGYLSVSPGTLDPQVAAVVEHAGALIDSIGHDALLERGTKGGFIARGFLPEESLQLGSPYLDFALDERVVGPVAAYLGVVPVLTDVDVWYSAHHRRRRRAPSSGISTTPTRRRSRSGSTVDEIDAPSGPLTVLDAGDSERDRRRQRLRLRRRVPARRTSRSRRPLRRASRDPRARSTSSTRAAASTSAAASRPRAARAARVFQYLTPYSFKFADHRNQAGFRHLATGESSPLERLVLGAA